MARVLILYIALIFAFFVQTEGFTLQQEDWLYCVLKTLPCIALSVIVFFEYTPLKGDSAFMHSLGLLFGSIGDLVIALYDDGHTLGAIAFGIGHLFYVSKIFVRMKQLSYKLLFIAVLYGIFMTFFFIIPQFSVAPITTTIFLIYSIILCTSFVLCGSTYICGSSKSCKQIADLICFIGYGLFFVSDSLILLNHVGKVIPYHSIAIFLTYFSSQYMILIGATQKLV